jgi:MFS family permease
MSSDRNRLKENFLRDLDRVHDHNALMNLMDGIFFSLGFACILPGIVIVSFLKHYTDNKFLLNLPVFISTTAFALGPFLASFVSGRYPSKKRVMNATAVAHRLSWIPVLLSVLLFRDHPRILLPVFLVTYTVFYACWGWSSIFWREMMGRLLHPDRQASAMGNREAISNIIGFGSGFGVLAVLSFVPFPANYPILFGFFLVTFSVALFFLFRYREAEYPVTHHEHPSAHLRSVLALPAKDPHFRWFLLFILLSYGNLFTGSLYTTIGLDRFSSDRIFGIVLSADRLTGLMTVLTLLSTSIFSLILGRMADKRGRLWGYLPGTVMSVLLPLWAIFAHRPLGYLGLFLFTGTLSVAWFMELFVTLNFAPPEKRHLYIALVSLVKLVPVVIYTNVGGWIAQNLSPVVTLAVSSVFCLAGLFVMLFKLAPEWTRMSSKPASVR